MSHEHVSQHHEPLFDANRAYRIDFPAGQLWVTAGHRSSALHTSVDPRGEDAIRMNPERGAFVVCDGAGGETNQGENPEWPASAANRAADVLIEEFSDIPPRKSADQIGAWALKAMDYASADVMRNGGGITTAVAVGPTYDAETGEPILVMASRGDSRALAYPPRTDTRLPGTIQQKLAKLEHMKQTGADKSEIDKLAFLIEQRKYDGSLPYELNTDGSEGLESWVGSNGFLVGERKLVGLRPNKRQTIALLSDGVSGSGTTRFTEPSDHLFIPRETYEHAFQQPMPQQTANMLFNSSQKEDDKSVVVANYLFAPNEGGANEASKYVAKFGELAGMMDDRQLQGLIHAAAREQQRRRN